MTHEIRIGRQILYLSQADVIACGIGPEAVIETVEQAFLAKSRGLAVTRPKIVLRRPDGPTYMAKAAATLEPNFGTIKWLGHVPANARAGVPEFHPMVLLNEGGTGYPVCLMDGVWITELRTGAMSAVAAKYMARPEASRIGFIACGTQARGHLTTIAAVRPIREVVAYSRKLETAQAFARMAREQGYAARATTEPREAVEGLDIVVSSVPHRNVETPFLDAGWLSPGTFVSMVELGVSWIRPTLNQIERTITDDYEQSGPGGSELLAYDGELNGDLADVVGGKLPGRGSDEERSAFIFSGVGLGDVGPATLIYRTALAKGLGTLLPL